MGFDSQGAATAYPRPRRPRIDPITGLESLTDEDTEENAATGGLPQGLLDRYLTPIVESAPAGLVRTAVSPFADLAPAPAPAPAVGKDKEPLEPLETATQLLQSAGRRVKDLGIGALKGAIGIPEFAVGLADIPSGGRAGQALESVGFEPGLATRALNAYLSPEAQAASRAFREAEGPVDTALAVLRNPSLIPQTVVESAPSMLPSAAIARGAQLLPAALRLGPAAAAGLGEGLVAAGSAAEQIRQATPGGLLSPWQSGAAAASGAITGGLGALGGKFAGSKLGQRLGIVDPDALLAGAARNPEMAVSLTRRVLSSAFSEGVLEEFGQSVSEQVLQNAALGRPLEEGVDQAAVLGTIAGAVMGGGGALVAGARGARPEPQEYPITGARFLPDAMARLREAPPEPRASPGPFPIEDVGYQEWLRGKEEEFQRDQEEQVQAEAVEGAPVEPTAVRYLATGPFDERGMPVGAQPLDLREEQAPAAQVAPGAPEAVPPAAETAPVREQLPTGAEAAPVAVEPPAPNLYDVNQDPEGYVARGLKGKALEEAARRAGYSALQAGEGISPLKPTAASIKGDLERVADEEAQAEADRTGVARETAAGKIIYPTPKLTVARDPSLKGDIGARQEQTIAHLEADPKARLAEYWEHMKAIGKPENMVAIDDARDVVDPGYRDATDDERAVMTPGNLAAARALGQAAWEQKLSLPPKRGPRGERPRVIIQAGGPGSGKTSALAGNDFSDADIVVEATHTQWPAVKKRIDEALASGRDVELHYVYADVANAMPRVLNRAMKEGGRTAEVGGVINAHHAGPETLIRAVEHYTAQHPGRVKFRVRDNTVPFGELAIDRDVDFLRQVVEDRGRYGKEVDYRYAIEATHEAYQRGLRHEPGGISEAVYRGTLHGTGVEPRLGPVAGPRGAVGEGRGRATGGRAEPPVVGRHEPQPDEGRAEGAGRAEGGAGRVRGAEEGAGLAEPPQQRQRRQEALLGKKVVRGEAQAQPYEVSRLPHEQAVRVTFPDGSVHYDKIKGLNQGHALARAEANWDGATIEPLTEGEYDRAKTAGPQYAARPAPTAPTPTIERVVEERPRKLLIQTRPDLVAEVDYAVRTKKTALPIKASRHTVANAELDVSAESLREISESKHVGKLTQAISDAYDRIDQLLGKQLTSFVGLNPSGDHYGVWYKPAGERGAVRTNPFALMGKALADVPAPQTPQKVAQALAKNIIDVLVHERRHDAYEHDTEEASKEFDRIIDADAARLLPIRDRLEAPLRRVLEENHGEVGHAIERLYHQLHPEWATLQAGRAGWAESFPRAEAAAPHGAPERRAPGAQPEPRPGERLPTRGGEVGPELARDVRRGYRAPAAEVGPSAAYRRRRPGPGGRPPGGGEGAGPRREARRVEALPERGLGGGLSLRHRIKLAKDPVFQRWFKKSTVSEGRGIPKVVYHATTTARDFDAFDRARTKSLGIHFAATPDQANDILVRHFDRALPSALGDPSRTVEDYHAEAAKTRAAAGHRIFPTFLSIQNPLRLTTDFGFENPPDTIAALYKSGKITKREFDAYREKFAEELGEFPNWPKTGGMSLDEIQQLRGPLNDGIIDLLKTKGYDGIEYPNVFEGRPGARGNKAWVVFDPEQIKSATGNRGTWSAEDTRVQYSTRRAVEYEDVPDPRDEAAKIIGKSYGVTVDVHEAGQLLQSTKPEDIEFVNQHLPEAERYRQELRAYFDRPEKKRAPIWFSALQRGVEAAKQNVGPGGQWLKMLQGNQTIKKAELKWTALDDFLKSKAAARVTKAEILDFLEKNDVKIEEVLLGEGADTDVSLRETNRDFTDEERPEDAHPDWEPDPDFGEYTYTFADQNHPDYEFLVTGNHDHGFMVRGADGEAVSDKNFDSSGAAADAASKWLEEKLKEEAKAKGIAGPPQYAQYTGYANKPAGQNYRELLLKMPDSPRKISSYDYLDPDQPAQQKYGPELAELEGKQREYHTKATALRDLSYRPGAQELIEQYQADRSLADAQLPAGYHLHYVEANPSYRRWILKGPHHDDVVAAGANPFSPMADAWNQERAEIARDVANLKYKMQEETRERLRAAPGQARPRSVPAEPFTAHYHNYPNTFAHVRFEERTAPDGSRVLFIQEIQDDVNNAIRKFKAESVKLQKKIDSGGISAGSVTSFKQEIKDNLAKAAALEEALPFRDTSNELIMKRMIRWAAENGFDKVAWTTGEQQNRRYALTQTARKITYEPRSDTTTALWIEGKQGGDIQEQLLSRVKDSTWEESTGALVVPDSMMAEILGGDLSMRMVNQEGTPVLPEKKEKVTDGYTVQNEEGETLDEDGDWVDGPDNPRVFDTERQAERYLDENYTETIEDDDGEEYEDRWQDRGYSTESYEAPRIPFEPPRYGFTVRDRRVDQLVDDQADPVDPEGDEVDPIVFQTREEAQEWINSRAVRRVVDARSGEYILEGGNYTIEGRAAPSPQQLGFAGADFEAMGEPPPPPVPPAPKITKRAFTGLELEIGGKGKEVLYDEIIPQAANKYIKKWGVRSEKLDLGFKLKNKKTSIEEPHLVHSFDITPEMKRTALYAGAPKFMKRKPGPGITTAGRVFGAAYAQGGGDVEAKPGAEAPHPDIGLNIQKYDLPTDVQERLSAAVESLDAAGALPRDIPMTTAEVNKRAADILHWVSAEQIRKVFKEADRNSVAMVTAMRRVLLEQNVRVEEALAAFQKANTSGATRAEIDKLHDNYHKATSDQSANIAAFSGKVGEAARILAFQKQVLKAGRTGPEQLRDTFFQALRDQGVAKSQVPGVFDLYMKSLSGLAADQAAYVKGLRKAFDPGLLTKITELWKAMLLSGPATPVANAIGNTLNMAVDIAKTGTAGVLDSHRFLTGAPRERYVGEMGAQLAGITNALPTAIRQLISDFGKIGTFKEVSPDVVGGGKVEHQIGAISGVKGRVIRTPFRILDVTDNFFKTLISSGESSKLAHRDGRKRGYEGHVLHEHMKDVIEKIRDGRDEALAAEVKNAVLRGTFQQKEGKFGSGIQSLKRELPWLEFLVPFVRTPGNIAKTTWQMTPGGLLTVARDLYRGGVPKAEIMDKLALTMLGSTFATAMLMAAKQGLLTGSGPADKRERALKLSTGWQPNSIHWKSDGKDQYASFSRFEPVGAIMGMAADLAESKDERNAKSTFMKLTGSLASNMTSKTYLQGLSDFFQFYSDPINQGQRYVQQLAGTVVPNIAARAAAAIDPTLREETDPNIFKGIGKHIAGRIPGVSQKLEPRYTATGREKERGGTWVSRLFSPSSYSEAKDGMQLEKELIRIGYVPADIKREVRLPGGVKIRLTDQEFTQLQRANYKAAAEAARLMRTSYYRRLPDTAEEGGTMSKENLMKQLFLKRRADARLIVGSRSDFRRRTREALAENRATTREREARETL